MKGALVRALVGGSVFTAGWIGLSLAIGEFNLYATIGMGLFMACFFAVMPFLLRSANRGANPSQY
jgi:hypothetical protein